MAIRTLVALFTILIVEFQDARDGVEQKQPSVKSTIAEGERIVGDCRFTDSTPARDSLAGLSNLWEELLAILEDM